MNGIQNIKYGIIKESLLIEVKARVRESLLFRSSSTSMNERMENYDISDWDDWDDWDDWSTHPIPPKLCSQ